MAGWVVDADMQRRASERGQVSSFLGRALEPPSTSAVSGAVALLQHLGALDEDERLTAMGMVMLGSSASRTLHCC